MRTIQLHLTLLALIEYHLVSPSLLAWHGPHKMEWITPQPKTRFLFISYFRVPTRESQQNCVTNLPKLYHSMLLAAGRMICRNICHPSFPPKKVTALTMYIQGLCIGCYFIRIYNRLEINITTTISNNQKNNSHKKVVAAQSIKDSNSTGPYWRDVCLSKEKKRN